MRSRSGAGSDRRAGGVRPRRILEGTFAMTRISRRTVLKGLGTALAVPWLEGMASAAAGTAPPKRMVFVYVPNGVNMREWTPAATGRGYDMPSLLETLKEFRNDF